MNILFENNFTQIIKEQTHINGNTLDLLCVNDISIIKRNRCYYTRPSDHSVVTAELKLNSPQQKSCAQNTSREILVNSKEDVIKFREVLNETCQSICR